MRDRHSGVAAFAALLGLACAWLVLGGTLDTGPDIPEPPVARRLVALESSLETPQPGALTPVSLVPRLGPSAELEVVPVPDAAFFCEVSSVAGGLNDGLPVRVEPLGLDDSVWVEAQVAHGGVWIDPSTPRGTSRVHVQGYLPATLDWWDESCRDLVLEPSAGEVAGEVLDSEGWPVPGAWVRCPSGETAADGDGRFRCELPSRRVTLTARRLDGLLTVMSDPVVVTPGGARSAGVVLTLPAGPQGGIGAALRPVEEGVLLSSVVPGFAAHKAGLSAGDTLLEVDGEPLMGLSNRDVVRRIVGAVGTDVELFARDPLGVTRRLVLTRGRVESHPTLALID